VDRHEYASPSCIITWYSCTIAAPADRAALYLSFSALSVGMVSVLTTSSQKFIGRSPAHKFSVDSLCGGLYSMVINSVLVSPSKRCTQNLSGCILPDVVSFRELRRLLRPERLRDCRSGSRDRVVTLRELQDSGRAQRRCHKRGRPSRNARLLPNPFRCLAVTSTVFVQGLAERAEARTAAARPLCRTVGSCGLCCTPQFAEHRSRPIRETW
jgi:hypothetical protein